MSDRWVVELVVHFKTLIHRYEIYNDKIKQKFIACICFVEYMNGDYVDG